jgi:sec-independent protein translocase protein TatC
MKAIQKKMHKFLSGLWQVITYPFRAIYNWFPKFFDLVWRVITFPFLLIYKIIAFPFQAVYRFNKFLNTEPEERPLTEIFVELTTNQDTRQMMWDQVEALRMHIFRALIILSATVIASFWFSERLMEFMSVPVGGLEALQAIDPTEGIGVFMRVALTAGIAIASPYIAFELWLFAAPGLHAREKKFGLMGIPLASFLFVLGMLFTFYVLLPPAIPFLEGFTKIHQFWSAQKYFSLVTGLMIWIGMFFEFPLVIYILSAMGVVQPQFLAEQWKLAIVFIAIISAAVTPTIDPVNMGLVMIPMILLYFVSIGLSYIAYAGRKRNQAEEQKKANEAETS